VLFKYRFFPDIESGKITLTFRTWTKPQVKEGGRYRFSENGVLEVTSVRTVAVDDISDADAKRAGFADRASLLAFVKPVDGKPTFRVEFRFVKDTHDARMELAANDRLSSDEVEQIIVRLDKMDERSSPGSWAWRTLDLIAEHPRVRAPDLAEKLGWETQPFKANVRKLKALGLTMSHEIGYELSPRGQAFLAAMKKRGRT
jgi:hypothetical protein